MSDEATNSKRCPNCRALLSIGEDEDGHAFLFCPACIERNRQKLRRWVRKLEDVEHHPRFRPVRSRLEGR